MRVMALHEQGERTFALVFDSGDEPVGLLSAFADEHRVTAARFSGIGAFAGVTLGYFDLANKDYERIPIDEQVEVVSLIGNVAMFDGRPKVHAHVVVAGRNGLAHGGHLLDAWVRPTLELMLEESPRRMARRTDPDTGLALLSFGWHAA